DKSIVSATANNEAIIGTFSVKSERLATSDMLIAERVELDAAYGKPAGDYAFQITAGGNTSDITVTLDGSETNAEAMDKIAIAINSNDDAGASAAIIRDTSTTGRLTLSAADTGADNRITITDSSGLLSPLGLDGNLRADTTNRRTADNTSAGYATADYTELNSQVKINGITVTRNSNTIEDALNGITLTLNDIHEDDQQPVYLRTDVGTQEVESFVEDLLNNYNSTLQFLRNQKDMRRSDMAANSLYTNLRSISTSAVSTAAAGDPKYLSEIGISYEDDGSLTISDSDRLRDFLKDDPQKVANLFTSEDGFVAKINSVVGSLVGDGGLILARTRSLSEQIDSTAKRTADLQERIDTQAANMREEYTAMLEAYYEAQNQYNNLFISADTSGYNSLLF
ncbi:MAG: flagellar filament capping protein FliD, partial [Bacteroidota bacterium]